MTPAAGEIWLADVGAETGRPVYVVSDDRFHRLAERALVAPVLPSGRVGPDPPWWVPHESSVVALDRLSSIPVDRLLEQQGIAHHGTVRAVQRTIRWLTTTEH